MSVVVNGSHLTLHYSVAIVVDGQPRPVVDSFATRPATLTIGAGPLAAPLEQCLIGLREGDERAFAFAAGAVYGLRQAALLQTLSRTLFDAHADPAPGYQAGDVVEFRLPDGGRVGGVIRSQDDQCVVVDFNHPLAGHEVRFRVQILGIL